MISGHELKKGITIEMDGLLYQVLDYQHIKLGRGSAQLRIKLRDLKGGHITERSFQASEKFRLARLVRQTVQYLYHEDDLYYFMDTKTYEQMSLTAALLGDGTGYLVEGMNVDLLTYNDSPVGVELPIAVELKVKETGPGFKGDTATAGNKPATLETGMVINVPLFVNTGDVVKVDNRTGQYLERKG